MSNSQRQEEEDQQREREVLLGPPNARDAVMGALLGRLLGVNGPEEDDPNDTSPEMEEYRRKLREYTEEKKTFVNYWNDEEKKRTKRFRNEREGATQEFLRTHPEPKKPQRARDGCNCERCNRIRNN